MGHHAQEKRGWLMIVIAVLSVKLLLAPLAVQAACFPAIFNFGDGSSDTGSIHASFPTILTSDSLPYGSTYFAQPSYRYSDGRLVVDFLAEALGIPFLSPYLQSVTSDFSGGANFATAGSTAGPVSTGQTAGPYVFLSPFGLNVQVMQFQEFVTNVKSVVASETTSNLTNTLAAVHKSGQRFSVRPSNKPNSLETSSSSKPVKASSTVSVSSTGRKLTESTFIPAAVNASALAEEAPSARLPQVAYFSSGLYIVSIGGSDITNAFNLNNSISQVTALFPTWVGYITGAVRKLYQSGARNVIVVDVEPLGCQPFLLTIIPHQASDLDAKGCLIAYNGATQNFNAQLKSAVQFLRPRLSGLNLYYLSQYFLKIDLLNNLAANGFSASVLNKACCGVPSAHNVNPAVGCGSSVTINNILVSARPCLTPSQYVYWDGVYNTEAANRYVAKKILAGSYFDVPFTALTSCGLKPI